MKMARVEMSEAEAREFVSQCFRLRHVHWRWRCWLRIALREARRSMTKTADLEEV